MVVTAANPLQPLPNRPGSHSPVTTERLLGSGADGGDGGDSVTFTGEACRVPPPGEGLEGRHQHPIIYQTRPLPSVLIIHTGGTLGMSADAFEEAEDAIVFKPGTGGDYTKTLMPGKLLLDIVTVGCCDSECVLKALGLSA